MGKYIFSYSVDYFTIDGNLQMTGMIFDHTDVRNIISDAMDMGGTIDEVSVTMFDLSGTVISERNLTKYVTQAN